MNIFNIIIIIFLIIASITVYKALSKPSNIEDKNINPNMKSVCYGDDITCVPNVDCGLFNPATIQPCTIDPSGNATCNSCICKSNSKLRGCMTCQESDPSGGKVYRIPVSKSRCTGPLFWDEKEDQCKLKRGNFCLPKKITDVECNKFTGRKLLMYEPDVGYDWKCVCKNNTKFGGPRCDNINVCSMLGSVDNPKNYSQLSQQGDYRGLRRKSDQSYWNFSSDWDPFKKENTECQCRFGEIVDNERQVCLPNECRPGIPSQPDSSGNVENCVCPATFIDCAKIAYTTDDTMARNYNGACKIPSCVPDPCGGAYGTDGTYDTQTGKCKCAPGFYAVPDPFSFTGQSCKRLCVNNGPCGTRGTCAVNLDMKGFKKFTFRCFTENNQCKVPFQCMIIYNKNPEKPAEQYYVNYNETTKKLTLDNTFNGKSFSIEIKNADTQQPEKLISKRGKLSETGVYYLKFGDKYLSLIPDTSGNHNLLDSSGKEESLFKLLQVDFAYPDTTANIFIQKSYSYLSVKKEDSLFKIAFDPYTSDLEYCTDCKKENGWIQDVSGSLLCGYSCIKPEIWGRSYLTKKNSIDDFFGTGRKVETPPTDEEMKAACCSGKFKKEISKYTGDEYTNFKCIE